GLGEVAEEPQRDDLLLAGGQLRQRRVQRLAQLDLSERLVHHAETVPGRTVVVLADGCVQRRRAVPARRDQCLDDVVLGSAQACRQVGDGGGAAELLGQLV